MNPPVQEIAPPQTGRGRGSDGGYRVAIIGATGAVGSMLLKVLAERDFPVSELIPFASPGSIGKEVQFGDQTLQCQVLSDEAIQGIDIAFSAAGSSVIKEWAKKLTEAGAKVIDKSSAFRLDDEIRLVVPEVNGDVLTDDDDVIASPNCSTIQLVLALKPIWDEVGIERLVISTYQSVSGTGQKAIEELREQSKAILDGAETVEPSAYPHQIAFNALPHVDAFEPGDDYSQEERKLRAETKKILDAGDDLGISATCVRIPVFVGHSESVNVQTREELTPERCRAIIAEADGVTVLDDPDQAEYPLATQVAGGDEVFVGRIRPDTSADRCLNFWVVGDNLRKGAATNAVQLAELLHEKNFVGSRSHST